MPEYCIFVLKYLARFSVDEGFVYLYLLSQLTWQCCQCNDECQRYAMEC